MSKRDATDSGADLGGFITSAEMDRQLQGTFPHYARLVEAGLRRKRLLKAAARWRDRNMTQTALAEAMGSRQPAVARLELGKVDPKLSTMERYAAALGANFTWQIVNDKGRPVSKDFTWEADVAYRNSSPALTADENVGDVATSAESSSKPEDEKRQTKEVQLEPQNQPLEEAIARATWQPGEVVDVAEVAEVARQLSETVVFVLARRTKKAASARAYSNTELIRDLFDFHGKGVYGLPVFTRLQLIVPALVQNPSWRSYSVVQIRGREVLENVPSDVAIIINPETEPSFHIPRRNDRNLAYTAEPVAPAAELVPA
jgi:transcriptional regulator with XRE-family HTH domain